MRRKVVWMVATALVAAVAFTALAEREGQQQPGRGGFGNMSEEQRNQARQRFENMSEEERAAFREQMRQRFADMSEEQRAQMRGRFGTRLSREEQLKAVKAIEEQVAKLKAAIEKLPERDAAVNFRDMSEEERNKLREQMGAQRQEQATAIRGIETELAKLQGPRPERIATAGELQRVVGLAKEENAAKTTAALEGIIARAAARSERGPAEGDAPGRPVRGGDRGTRRPGAEGQNE